MEAIGKLTNLQLEILKLFNYNLPEDQIKDIKKLLSGYFAAQATMKMDEFFEKEKWDDKKIEEISKEHLRTKYL